jgi:anaerobic magnesium-protoporphyrin IX monomethyl ester cyclase
MGRKHRSLILNLPSPPNQVLWRDTAGGFGTSISCNRKYNSNGEAPLHPFLPYAASVLQKAGCEFEIFDGQRLGLDNEQVLSQVKKINPDIVFSIISLPSMKNDLKLLDSIKLSSPNVKTVGVGTICSILPEQVLEKSSVDVLLRNSYPYFDGVVELAGALQLSPPLKDIAGLSYSENGKIMQTSARPELMFDNLPDPNYDPIPLEGYEAFHTISGKRLPSVLILDGKGCPYGCIYCPYPLGYGRKLTIRPSNKIADEIEYLQKNRGINAFAFKGQTFAYSRKHALELCEEIIRRKLEISWVCESRVDEVNRELLEKMSAAGCQRIHFGVETGDAETLKIAKPGVKLEMIKKTFELTRKLGLATQAHVILGWPDDTTKTVNTTRKFLMQLNPDALNLNFFTPYPGTKMYEVAKQNSLLLTDDWTTFTSHKVVMRTKSLTEAQLYTLRNKIIRDFSLLKLKKLMQSINAEELKKPRPLLKKARVLVNKTLFPAMD